MAQYDYQVLKNELVTDPLGRGYAAMTNAAAATSLNAPYKTLERPTLSPAEIYEAIVQSEWVALTDAQRNDIRDILNLGGAVQIDTGKRARTVLLSIFGAATTTRSRLASLVQYQIPRCVEIDWPGGVGEADVAAARALP